MGVFDTVLLSRPAVFMSLLCFKVACPPIISWMWRWSFFRLLAISFLCLSALYTDTQTNFSDSFAFSHSVLLKFCKNFFLNILSTINTQSSRITRWQLNFRVFRLCYNIWTSAFWAPPFLVTFFEMFLGLKWSPPGVYSTGWTQIGKIHMQGWAAQSLRGGFKAGFCPTRQKLLSQRKMELQVKVLTPCRKENPNCPSKQRLWTLVSMLHV